MESCNLGMVRGLPARGLPCLNSTFSVESGINRSFFYFWHFSFSRPLAEETA
jgi:hypothetical protein